MPENYGITESWEIDPSRVKFTQRVLNYADYLERQYGGDVSARYMALQIKLLSVPHQVQRDAKIDHGYVKRSELETAVLEFFHIDRLPVRAQELMFFLRQQGIKTDRYRLNPLLNNLVDEHKLRKQRNPWHGRSWVYCNIDFASAVQPGDRVVLLNRKASHKKSPVTGGTVIGWQMNKQIQRLFPVVRLERHYGITTEFVDPGALIIIDRPKQENQPCIR